MNTVSFTDRNQLWKDLKSGDAGDWDVIIIGGGITGAGVLREAVRRGYKSLLIEQRDFAWGSSSRSSKMVHGGLRYLAAGNISLTRHALQERESLIGTELTGSRHEGPDVLGQAGTAKSKARLEVCR